MKAYHDRNSNVTIEFNSQCEILEAPPTTNGERRKYLPCDVCGRLMMVALNVVSSWCDSHEEEKISDSNIAYRAGYDYACGYHD